MTNISRLSVLLRESSIRPQTINKELNNIVYAINNITNGVSSSAFIVLSPQTVAPALQQGAVYLNSVDQQVYVCKDGLTWSIMA